MKWFTSDLHLFHRNILSFCSGTRIGKDVHEMNENIIRNWNEDVAMTDEVYLLGDVSFGNRENTLDILERLNGRIYLILGNHDHVITKNKLLQERFEWIKHYQEETIDGIKVCMMHFPIENWNRMGSGAIMLHGHIHGDSHHTCRKIQNRMDVGLDTTVGMRLYSWEDVLYKLNYKKG